jgi:hypothetical protein
MEAMIACIERFDTERRGVTTSAIIDEIKLKTPQDSALQADLRGAVEDLCGRIDGLALGYKFRHFARRNFGGKMIVKGAQSFGANRWLVQPVVRAGRCPSSPSCPSGGVRGEGDEGHEGHAGPQLETAADQPPKRKRYGNDDRPHADRG